MGSEAAEPEFWQLDSLRPLRATVGDAAANEMQAQLQVNASPLRQLTLLSMVTI